MALVKVQGTWPPYPPSSQASAGPPRVHRSCSQEASAKGKRREPVLHDLRSTFVSTRRCPRRQVDGARPRPRTPQHAHAPGQGPPALAASRPAPLRRRPAPPAPLRRRPAPPAPRFGPRPRCAPRPPRAEPTAAGRPRGGRGAPGPNRWRPGGGEGAATGPALASTDQTRPRRGTAGRPRYSSLAARHPETVREDIGGGGGGRRGDGRRGRGGARPQRPPALGPRLPAPPPPAREDADAESEAADAKGYPDRTPRTRETPLPEGPAPPSLPRSRPRPRPTPGARGPCTRRAERPDASVHQRLARCWNSAAKEGRAPRGRRPIPTRPAEQDGGRSVEPRPPRIPSGWASGTPGRGRRKGWEAAGARPAPRQPLRDRRRVVHVPASRARAEPCLLARGRNRGSQRKVKNKSDTDVSSTVVKPLGALTHLDSIRTTSSTL